MFTSKQKETHLPFSGHLALKAHHYFLAKQTQMFHKIPIRWLFKMNWTLIAGLIAFNHLSYLFKRWIYCFSDSYQALRWNAFRDLTRLIVTNMPNVIFALIWAVHIQINVCVFVCVCVCVGVAWAIEWESSCWLNVVAKGTTQKHTCKCFHTHTHPHTGTDAKWRMWEDRWRHITRTAVHTCVKTLSRYTHTENDPKNILFDQIHLHHFKQWWNVIYYFDILVF